MNLTIIRLLSKGYGYFLAFVAFSIAAFNALQSQAGPLTVGGSRTYDTTTQNGFSPVGPPRMSVNNSGLAAGQEYKYVAGVQVGIWPVRWDSTGTGAAGLGVLGLDSNNSTEARVYQIDETGTAVGYVTKYVSGFDLGTRPVRWSATGTTATELAILGLDNNNSTDGTAFMTNASGITVGYVNKNVGSTHYGNRPVRWDAAGNLTELGTLGTANVTNFVSYARAGWINDSGTIAGSVFRYVSGNSRGYVAVRWDAGSTIASELASLGTDSLGNAVAFSGGINSTGTIFGYSRKYVSGSDKGLRAVRWNAGGTTATELATLGTQSNGNGRGQSYGINDAGTVVGVSDKYVSNSYKGGRAVRWGGTGSAVTELANLGTNSSGSANSEAYAINNAGMAVGYSEKYVSGTLLGNRAVAWLPDASVIDLNDLGVLPVGGGGTWTLFTADALSADGWASGIGGFTPTGSSEFYWRGWVGQIGLGGNWLNTSGINNTWGKGANWSTGTPAIQRDAVFNQTASYSVDFSRDEMARNVTFNSGTVTLTLGSHSLTVANGLSTAAPATLQGEGTIVGNVTNNGTLAPGTKSSLSTFAVMSNLTNDTELAPSSSTSIGTFTVLGNLTSSGILEFDLANLSTYDQVNLTGHFSAGGTIKINLLAAYEPTLGSTFDVLDFGSFVNAGYAFDFTNAALGPGLAWNTDSFASTGVISIVPIPEPSSIVFAAIGLTGLLLWRRRQSEQ